MEKLTLSIPEVAQVLGVSKPTAYALANSKGFPILKIGKRKVVPVRQLQIWIDKNSQTSA
jgi:excisionase family DNA binding protein